jgi:hypothetical protein
MPLINPAKTDPLPNVSIVLLFVLKCDLIKWKEERGTECRSLFRSNCYDMHWCVVGLILWTQRCQEQNPINVVPNCIECIHAMLLSNSNDAIPPHPVAPIRIFPILIVFFVWWPLYWIGHVYIMSLWQHEQTNWQIVTRLHKL